MEDLKNKIRDIINLRRDKLQSKIRERKIEMELDSSDHYMLYNLLGFSEEKGYEIDLYHNIGRFLYAHAGALIEEITLATFEFSYPNAKSKFKIDNSITDKPKKLEIDCLIQKDLFSKPDAIEIKWRDSTTDGDHVNKEKSLVLAVKDKGYNPVRIMFFYPTRSQSIRTQKSLERFYDSHNGEFYTEQAAWDYVHSYTGINLKQILIEITSELN